MARRRNGGSLLLARGGGVTLPPAARDRTTGAVAIPRAVTSMQALGLDRSAVFPAVKFACAAAVGFAPLFVHLSGVAALNAHLSAYAVATVTLAAIVAEAEWERHANLALGAWVAAAPILFDFSGQYAAAGVHAVAGALLVVISAAGLWPGEEGNPPWKYRPNSAARAVALSRTVARADRVARSLARRLAEPAPSRRTRAQRKGAVAWAKGVRAQHLHTADVANAPLPTLFRRPFSPISD
jgi:hypothetical protein